MEHLKKIPLPIWIGLGLVLLVIFIVNSKPANGGSQQAQTTAGPVTANTVGSAGQQSNAGTDQQLGNLSQMTQGGIAEIIRNQESMQTQIATLQSGNQSGYSQSVAFPPDDQQARFYHHLQNGMNGSGTQMTQFGGAIQNTQNASAQRTAQLYSNGMYVSNWQG